MTEFNTQIAAAAQTEAAVPATVETKKRGATSKAVERTALTQEHVLSNLELREDSFEVEGENGEMITVLQKNFYWKVANVAGAIGSFAGTRRIDGYYSLTLLGNSYSGERLIAFAETGEWPEVRRGRASSGEAKDKAPKALVVREAPRPLSPKERALALAKAKEEAAARKAAKAAKAAEGQPAAVVVDNIQEASTNDQDTADLFPGFEG